MEKEPKQQEEENLSQQELSPLQVKAELSMDKLKEIGESAERVKNSLAGLIYKPPTDIEMEKLQELGMPIFKKSGLGGFLLKNRDEKIDFCLSSDRVDQLIEREKSIKYLLSNQRQGLGGGLKSEDLSDARFFSITELIERADEKIKLNQQAKEQVLNPDADQPALQRLVDEYIFRQEEIFDINEKTGRIKVKKFDKDSMEKVQKFFDLIVEESQWYKEQISSILESGRTGIDPGVLIVSNDRRKISYQVKNVAGRFDPPSRFTNELGETGLILVPPFLRPHVLKHEYAHFENQVLRERRREGLDRLINEINSFLLQYPEYYTAENKEFVFENMKGILLSYYLNKDKPSSMPLKEAKEKVAKTVDTVRRLYKNGFSREVISSILLHSDKFEDILAWNNINDEEVRKLAKAKKENLEEPKLAA